MTKVTFCCNAEDNFPYVVKIHEQNEFDHSNVQKRLNENIKPLFWKHGGFVVKKFCINCNGHTGVQFFILQTALDGESSAEVSDILIVGDGKGLQLLPASTV